MVKETTCINCNKTKTVKDWRSNRASDFCSIKCRYEHYGNSLTAVCPICKQTFNYKKGVLKRVGRGTFCSRECHTKSQQYESYKNQEERIRAQSLRTKFGITLAQYDAMFFAQESRCKLCLVRQSEVSRRFAVDHNHVTGEVRGLLCCPCNTGIGALKESPELLERAITYLRRK